MAMADKTNVMAVTMTSSIAVKPRWPTPPVPQRLDVSLTASPACTNKSRLQPLCRPQFKLYFRSPKRLERKYPALHSPPYIESSSKAIGISFAKRN